ncbi:zf-HC2 domain-containing protein [Rubrobacter indicoceani]|uniref:zf-HC2 domain-containing protein n=1 Tax=Rubrobacter indicoceani TaxID=2051957 RepID=UPI000E5C4A31|nr:zf-HC2 domain-containing protein [Rubrobacter indicoceani]
MGDEPMNDELVRGENCRRCRELLGASLLGGAGLTTTEREELDRHLAGCPACRREEVELRETAKMLSDGGARTEADPSPDLEDRVVARVLGGSGRRSGSERYAIPAAAAIFAVFVGVGVLLAFLPDGGDPGLGDTEEISFPDAPQGIASDGAVIAHTWGTEVIMELSGLEDGEVYTVTVERRDGTTVESGTFIGTGASEIECEMNAAVLRQNARAVLISDSDGRPVMRSELEPRPASSYT